MSHALPTPPPRPFSPRGPRHRHRLALLLATLLGALCASCGAPPSAPGVVFIVIDDLNDWVGFLGGHPDAHTPNIDRLAARGVAFTRAYAPSSMCNPSRTAVMTGLRPTTSGVYWNGQPLRAAMPQVVTLPERLRRAGFVTAEAGKVLHQPDPPSWDERRPAGRDPEPPGRPVNGIASDRFFDWGPIDVPDSAMVDRQTVEWAGEWLEARGDEPFFLAVGLGKPHLPWFVPRPYFEALPAAGVRLPEVIEDDLADLPGRRALNIAHPESDHRLVLEHGVWGEAVAAYLAAVRFADARVGELLAAIEEADLAERTIIVLWSDHGFHLGEKQHWRKTTLWEEGTRVPLIVVAPGVTTPGAVCERPVSLLDLYPTLLELLDLPLEPVLERAGEGDTTAILPEGRSLVPWLLRPETPAAGPALSMLRRDFSARSERWRYTRYVDGGEELYDHDADPHEWHNLASDPAYAAIRAELGALFPTEYAADGPRALPPPEEGGSGARGADNGD